MNDTFLASRLDRVHRRHRWLVAVRMLAVCWAGTALVCAALVGVQRAFDWTLPGAVTLVIIAASVAAAVALIAVFLRPPNYRWLAQRIEATHPSLNGVLLTAVEQPVAERAAPDFLQYRVFQEAIRRSQEQDWQTAIPTRRFVAVHVVHAVALACLVVALAHVRQLPASHAVATKGVVTADGVTVTPGDARLERGDTLVVLARFGRGVPAQVSLVIEENGAAPRSIPLVKSLADPVFGGSVTDATQSFTYRIDYGGKRTRAFNVTVFEHPRLVRADADLAYPEYTKLAPKHIEDTRRVSAVEGTHIDLVLQLNKPVKSAKLVARGDAASSLACTVERGKPAAKLLGWVPAKSGTYDLQLVDADGLANKAPISFVVDVQPNRPPEIKLASPRGDLRPSSLEEVAFQGTVWDDFGTLAYGLEYALAGGETKSIELGRNVPPKTRQPFAHLLSLEDLGAKPDDLVSWHVWAEDIGPDGKPRRSQGDLYFAEVRPFDEAFRESQGMQSAEDEQQGNSGDATRQLAELQKQVINATWKLRRDGPSPTYATDVAVVRDSQQQVLEQAKEAAEKVRSPRARGLWQSATGEMTRAVEKLKAANKDPQPLAEALPPEQAAYQALLKLQPRETRVTRRQRTGQGNRGQAANQSQIDQLDLQQAENRYETQRQARAPQTPQRREQLATMNRLQDLARRQQDINERLKELQTSLQEAQTEQQREALRQQLKRLEEEQRQMLADTDELRQRMDRAENQSTLSAQRQELDRARDDSQRAADAAQQGQVAQALAAGTRAQRQLQQTRDELRQQSSSQFGDELRDMRSEARDLSRRQQELERQLSAAGTPDTTRRTLSSTEDHPELTKQLAEQRERWNRLLDRARETSEQAETSEPLVSKQLYDSVRKVAQDDTASVTQLQQDLLGEGELTMDLRDRLQQAAQGGDNGKALDWAGEMMRAGNPKAADRMARNAGQQIDELKRGVEQAAESVIGDDTQELKLARSELDRLTDDLQREMSAAQGNGERDAKAGEAGRRSGAQLAGGESSSSDTSAPPQGNPRTGGRETPGGERDRTRETRTAANERRGAKSNERAPNRSGDQGVATSENGQARQSESGTRRRPGQPGTSIDTLLSAGAENGGGGGGRFTGEGPLTGGDFGPWANRLRDVEDLIDSPDLRDALATARERARLLRRDYAQSQKKPDWTVVRLEVVKPLVDVRDRLADELARRESKESLAPIDHDPVPNRYAESVRRYYEELGKDTKTMEPRTQDAKSPPERLSP